MEVFRNFILKWYPAVFLTALLLVLLTPISNLNLNPDSIAENFYGRKQLIGRFSDFRLWIGDRVFPRVIVGEDGWLVFSGEMGIEDYQNTFLLKPKIQFEIRERLNTLNSQLSARGIKLLVVIVPNKNTIYPEIMPAEIPVINPKSRLDLLSAFLKQAPDGVQILDLRPVLLEAKKERQIYYKTDTHWNDYGAYVGYKAIVTELQKTFPDMRVHPLEDFKYESLGMQSLDLAANTGSFTYQEESFNLIGVRSASYIPLDLKNGRQVLVSTMPNSTQPRAVIYHDSFFFGMIPMIEDNFSRAVYVPHYTGDTVWNLKWIDAQQPDVVIIEFAERYLEDLRRIAGSAQR
jgi:hypothetical protein